MHEGLEEFCKSKNLFEYLKLLVQLRTRHLQRAMFVVMTFKLFFQTIPRIFVVAYCSQFSLVKSKANSNFQKRKWYDGKIFISIFYRQFIINLYLYSSVILPTILRLVYKKWASSSLPFNQICFFLNPRFSLFNLKTDISSLLLKSKNGSD